MELDDRLTTIGRIDELVVTRIAPTDGGGFRSRGKDLLDRVRTRPATRLDVADLGDLPESEGGILRLQVDDELPERRREGASIGLLGLGKVGEQACHSMAIESIRLPS